MSELGGVITAVLVPVVKWLNTILAYLAAVARAFRAVFGKGSANDAWAMGLNKAVKDAMKPTAEVAASAGGIADGMSSAAASAKELKKTIAGFDELEILNAPDSGGGSGGISVGGGGYDVGTYFDPDDYEMPDLGEFEANAKKVIQTMADLADYILNPVIKAVKKLWDYIYPEDANGDRHWDWKKVLNLVGLTAAGLGILGFIKGVAKESWGLLNEAFSGTGTLWDKLVLFVAGFGKQLFKNIAGIGASIVKLVEQIIRPFKWIFQNAATWLNPVTIAIAGLVAGFITCWKSSEEFRTKVTNAAKTLYDYLKGVITDLWQKHLKPLWDSLKILVQSVIDLIKSVWGVVKELWMNILAPILGYIAAGVATLVGGIIAVVTGLLAKIIGFAADLTSITVGLVAWLITTISGLIDGLKTPIQNFWSWLEQLAGGIKQILTGIIEVITGIFTLNWQKAWQGVKDIDSGVWTTIKTVINGIIGAIESMVNGAVRALNRIHWNITLPSWLPIVGGKAWNFGLNLQTIYIPRLANGGVLQEATTAQLAEYAGAHNNPEIVTPENLMRQVFTESTDDLVVLLDRNNRLLEEILAKDNSITIGDDVISASAARGAKDYKKRTGMNQFA